MILSPYHNPPYRSPTPRLSNSPPPSKPSPKRKRLGPVKAKVLSQAHAVPSDTAQSSDLPSSPRAEVAERLQQLQIQSERLDEVVIPETPAVPRKRVKRESQARERVIKRTVESHKARSTLERDIPNPASSNGSSPALLEIQSTPDWRSQTVGSEPVTPEETARRQTGNEHTANDAAPTRVSIIQLNSPPQKAAKARLATLSTSDDAEEVSPDLIAMTWQESEITGHLIDYDLDDDGTGINGVGFRPTAAIATSRRMRRKQQVDEWKAREAREARRRRFERRTGGAQSGSDGAEPESSVTRAVRFAE